MCVLINHNTDKITSMKKDTHERPDLDGEENRDSTHYKPISTREYFKVLFYCLIGLVAVVLVIILFTVVIR